MGVRSARARAREMNSKKQRQIAGETRWGGKARSTRKTDEDGEGAKPRDLQGRLNDASYMKGYRAWWALIAATFRLVLLHPVFSVLGLIMNPSGSSLTRE